MDQPKPLITDPQKNLSYAHLIARTARGHTLFAMDRREIHESYKDTKTLLGRDTLMTQERQLSDYYQGRAERSLELAAALEIAIGVFARQIVDVHSETNNKKRTDRMREFGMLSTFPGSEEETLESAKKTLFVSEEVAIFLQDPTNRAGMRERFPDANLTDELINRLMPETKPLPQPHPSAG